MVYICELDQNLTNIIGTIFAVKISRKFAKNWWISLDQLLWSTEVNFCQRIGVKVQVDESIEEKRHNVNKIKNLRPSIRLLL